MKMGNLGLQGTRRTWVPPQSTAQQFEELFDPFDVPGFDFL